MKWLTVEQYAEIMQVDAYRVRRLCRDGELRCKKVGATWRIHPEEVE